MYSYKELNHFAGYTYRVYIFLSTLHLLRNDVYDVNKDESDIPVNNYASSDSLPLFSDRYYLDSINGNFSQLPKGREESFIDFYDVPIVAPNPGNPRGGDCLVKDLTFTVAQGEHLLINGPNGVGKSAIARVLAGIWPVFSIFNIIFRGYSQSSSS